MTMDYSQAPQGQDYSDLLPHGTLCFGVVKVRPFNLQAGIIETSGKENPENKYLNLELTIQGGPYDKRKIWDMPGVAGSEGYTNAGGAAIRAMLEVGRGASAQSPQGYCIDNYMELDGLKCAFRIKTEPGTAQYPNEKNRVAIYLTPLNPATEKDFARLVSGDSSPATNLRGPRKTADGAAASPPASQSRWGAQGDSAGPLVQAHHSESLVQAHQPTPATTTPAPNPNATPSWLTNPGPGTPQG